MIINILKYIFYTLTHKIRVFIPMAKKGFVWKGLIHDLSKFSLTEMINYSKLFDYYKQPWKYTYYNYKNDLPEKVYLSILKARSHHLKNNNHHWQNFLIIGEDGAKLMLDIPVDVKYEIICDWKARQLESGNDYKFWLNNNNEGFIYEDMFHID